MRRAARNDATQDAIVEALRACSVSVEIIRKPVDLLICCRGETSVMECKSPGGSFTKEQAEFLSRWPGKIHVCRTPEEALRAVLGEQHVQGDTLRV
jgi:hypothetical protein